MDSSNPNHQLLPVLSLLFAATLWGILWYPLRLLEDAGLQGLWVTLVSYCAALLTGIPFLWRDRAHIRPNGGLLLAMALAAGWCNVTFILAVLEGPVVRVLLLFYLSPLWAVLLGRMLLGERLHPISVITLLVALAGAITMLWDPAYGLPWPRSEVDWLAVSSGFAFALTNVLARKLDAVPVPLKTVATWVGVIAVALLGVLWMQPVLPQVGAGPWLATVLLGWFGFVIMTVTVVYGVTHMPVQRSAVILLFELVAGAVSSLWLADEWIRPQEWWGGSLIIAAALISARRRLEPV